ncbi:MULTISPECIES: hypothetical protein [unclassified Halobacteriovorax]|uniref:hypothetical protein n=1 Tax=unclassified Halobacteriovorax TaxID=2639665 RepID=UPI00399BB614
MSNFEQDPSPVASGTANIELSGDASGSPLNKSLNVVVSMPKAIEIKMVDASELHNVEYYTLISSIVSNFAVGFIVAYFQDISKFHLLFTSILFFLIFFASVYMAWSKRKNMHKESTAVALKARD